MNDVPADGKTMGEVVMRGNMVMLGYYNDPEATDRARISGRLVPQWRYCRDAPGWLH